MKRKLKQPQGLTLVEMLVATVLLALLGMMAVSGTQMAVKGYQVVVAESEAQLLLSTLSNAVSNELRYAPQAADRNTGFYQDIPKVYRQEEHEGEEVPEGEKPPQDGQVYIGNVALLPSGAYRKGAYQVEKLNITYHSGVYHVEAKVVGTNGYGKAETSFDVRRLNASSP